MPSSSSHPALPPFEDPPAVAPRHEAPVVDRAPWPAWTAPAGVVLGLVLGSVGTIVVDVVASASGSSVSHPPPAANIIADIVFDLCFVAAALLLASWRSRARPVDFGFRRVPLSTAVGA